MYSKLQALTYYLPDNELTNQDLEKRFDSWDASKIEAKVGIRNRHFASNNETALDLGFKAAEKLFINEKKDEIDFLIFCTQAPDYFLPSGSCILQDMLGLRKNIGAFDINLGCSGFVYGLSIADSFIKNGLADNVLLITADTYSKFINPKDISNLTIFGDAGAATIISKSEDKLLATSRYNLIVSLKLILSTSIFVVFILMFFILKILFPCLHLVFIFKT